MQGLGSSCSHKALISDVKNCSASRVQFYGWEAEECDGSIQDMAHWGSAMEFAPGFDQAPWCGTRMGEQRAHGTGYNHWQMDCDALMSDIGLHDHMLGRWAQKFFVAAKDRNARAMQTYLEKYRDELVEREEAVAAFCTSCGWTSPGAMAFCASELDW